MISVKREWYANKIRRPFAIDSIKYNAFLAQIASAEEEKKNVQRIRPFNPNTDSYDTLIAKGIPPKIAMNMLNYRTKIGEFKSADQLIKLYAVDSFWLARLLQVVELPGAAHSQPKINAKRTRVDLANCSLDQLDSVPGIGMITAKRILAYGKLLGGYQNIHQLSEVYGLDSIKFASLKDYFFISKPNIIPLDLNKADFKSLLRHPYLNLEQVKEITRYRKEHGDIKSDLPLYELKAFSERDVQRILPYLDLSSY